MTTTLSVRIDGDTKNELEALAKRARRSKSFLAAEAIAAYVEAEKWQLDEIEAGLKELDSGRAVAHKDVAKWLRSWGKKRERKAPPLAELRAYIARENRTRRRALRQRYLPRSIAWRSCQIWGVPVGCLGRANSWFRARSTFSAALTAYKQMALCPGPFSLGLLRD